MHCHRNYYDHTVGDGKLYHVDKMSKYYLANDTSRPTNHHSIVYVDDDVDYQPFLKHRKKRAVEGEQLPTMHCGA